jgi:hypothetical protein
LPPVWTKKEHVVPKERFATSLLKFFGFKGMTMSNVRTYTHDGTHEALIIYDEGKPPEGLKTVLEFLESKGYTVNQFILRQ